MFWKSPINLFLSQKCKSITKFFIFSSKKNEMSPILQKASVFHHWSEWSSKFNLWDLCVFKYIDNRKKDMSTKLCFGNQWSAIWQRVGCLLIQASRALALTRAYYFHFSIEKRSGKIGRDVSLHESHVLDSVHS